MALLGLFPSALLFFLLISCNLAARVTNPNKVPKNAVLLSNVESLTFRDGKQTTSRRVSPVSQMQCVGPANVCQLYTVDVMRCTNEGSDYEKENVQWSCKASLPAEFKLGSTDVSCEGYEGSDDPYVLKGSCGVEYRLLLTDIGEEKFGNKDTGGRDGSSSDGSSLGKYLFIALFLAVAFIIFRGWYHAWRQGGTRADVRRQGGFGGGGGGGPDDDDPPPPYDPHPPRYYGTSKKSTPRASYGTRSSSSRSGAQRQGSQLNFWTGTAAGAAAGYLFGSRNQTRAQPETAQRTGGLFGNRGSSSWTQQPSSSSSSSSRSPSYSSSRYESSGFGGTSRR